MTSQLRPTRSFQALFVVLLAFAASAVTTRCSAQASSAPTFHSAVNLVTVTFTARDSSGKLVGDLGQEDVEVLEDYAPQKIRYFARTDSLPLVIGLLVDASDSQHNFFKEHRHDVERFLKDVLGPQDKVFLIAFGNHLRVVSDLSDSIPQVLDNLDLYAKGKTHFPEMDPDDRDLGTAFFDAIFYSAREKLAPVEHARRALIAFSDGEDNSSSHTLLDTIEETQADDVLVYCVRYTEMKHGRLTARNKYGISAMRRLAADTGAADFDGNADTNLDATFRQIGAELHSLYEVAYHAGNPVRDGTFRKIQVRAVRPGITVRAKSGYFAQQ